MTPDETRQALIEALVRLMEHRSAAAISVRQVAAEAGVNHGLVHRYFGSKNELVREAVRHFSQAIHRVDTVHSGVSASSFAYLRAHPEIARIAARTCLEGPHDLLAEAAPPPEQLDRLVRPLARALRVVGAPAEADPYLLNAFASAALLGWIVFRPMLETGFGLPPDADERLERLLGRLDEALRPMREMEDAEETRRAPGEDAGRS